MQKRIIDEELSKLPPEEKRKERSRRKGAHHRRRLAKITEQIQEQMQANLVKTAYDKMNTQSTQALLVSRPSCFSSNLRFALYVGLRTLVEA